MNKRILITIVVLAGGTAALAACSKHHNNAGNMAASAGAAATLSSAATPATHPGTIGAAAIGTTPLSNLTYVAELAPLNGKATGDNTTGKAQFAVNNGMLTIRINVTGAPPGIMHAQHIHGFLNGKAAACPTQAADTNHDGVVSLAEAEIVEGPPLIPLNADPLAMNFTSLTYPKAAADGTYVYQETVSLAALQTAFAKAHNGQKLDLTKDNVMIHGVPPGTKSPTAATAMTTAATAGSSAIAMPGGLPIACGAITPATSQ